MNSWLAALWRDVSRISGKLMRPVACALLGLLIFTVAPASAQAPAPNRALVIGNSDYRWMDGPRSTTDDSAAVAEALDAAGFDVTVVRDLNLYDFLIELRNFQRGNRSAGTVVIYYSGYAISYKDANYLIPVSASLNTDLEILFETVPLDRAISAIEPARAAGYLILDSSRANPFAVSLRDRSPDVNIPDGLSELSPQDRTYGMLPSALLTIAPEGKEGLSPFAAALVAALQAAPQDADFEEVLVEVISRVETESEGAQVPVLFAPGVRGRVPAQPENEVISLPTTEDEDEVAEAAPEAAAEEDVNSGVGFDDNGVPLDDIPFWVSIVGTEDPDAYRKYLERYPDGIFASTAERLFASLGGGSDAPTATPPAPEVAALNPTLGDAPGEVPGAFGQGNGGPGDAPSETQAPPLVAAFAPLAPSITPPPAREPVAGADFGNAVLRRLEIEIRPETTQPEEAPFGTPESPRETPAIADLDLPDAAPPELEPAELPPSPVAQAPAPATTIETLAPTTLPDTSFDLAALPQPVTNDPISGALNAPTIALPPQDTALDPAIDASPAAPLPASFGSVAPVTAAAPIARPDFALLPDSTPSAPVAAAPPVAARPQPRPITLAALPVPPPPPPAPALPPAPPPPAPEPEPEPEPEPQPEPAAIPEAVPAPAEEPATDVAEDTPPAVEEPETDVAEAAPEEPAPEAEEPFVIDRTMIRNVQIRLNALGYAAGPPDGLMGRRTRGGIAAFQTSAGVPPTGEISPELVSLLADRISADRALFFAEVVDPFARAARRNDVAGAYCLRNPDGTLADGFERRDMICHYLRRVRGSQYELRSYYSHIRDPQGLRIFPLVSKFVRQSNSTFVDEHGSEITFTDDGMVIDREVFAPSPPLG